MRALWREIDHAKRKAGLDPAPEPPPPGWDITAMIERATALASDAAAWMTSNVPLAVALLATGAELLRNVPVVGSIVGLVSPPNPPPSAPKLPTRADANGHARPRPRILELEPDGDGPDGKWMH
ncbi:MAG: hypothetical protein ABIR79_04165 [Candidatus Binatia bacterium]